MSQSTENEGEPEIWIECRHNTCSHVTDPSTPLRLVRDNNGNMTLQYRVVCVNCRQTMEWVDVPVVDLNEGVNEGHLPLSTWDHS